MSKRDADMHGSATVTGGYRSGGEGITIRYALAPSPLATLAIALTPRGVCAVLLADDEPSALAALTAEFPRADLVPAAGTDAALLQAVVERVAGAPGPAVPLDLLGTAFQRRVWAELGKLPAGTTITYGELARRIGEPTAQRAVAGACGSNHVGVIVPCHRVIRSDGGLGGYKWGLERKRALLERETRR